MGRPAVGIQGAAAQNVSEQLSDADSACVSQLVPSWYLGQCQFKPRSCWWLKRLSKTSSGQLLRATYGELKSLGRQVDRASASFSGLPTESLRECNATLAASASASIK